MKKDARSLLESAKLKATPGRLAILDLFMAEKSPLTAKEAIERLGSDRFDLVTLYRTLKSFEEAGILASVSLGKDAVSYELAGDHHHHLVCLSCGDVEDFESCGLSGMEKGIVAHSKRFSRVTKHSFELFGFCKACDKKAR